MLEKFNINKLNIRNYMKISKIISENALMFHL